MPRFHDSRLRNTLLAAFAVVVSTSVAVARAGTYELTTPVRGGQTVSAAIDPAGEADTYGIHLFPNDRLTVTGRDDNPIRGLNSTLALTEPDGDPAAANVARNGTTKPKLTFQASEAGVHQLRITGAAGDFTGSAGNYALTIVVKRAKPAAGTAGGDVPGEFAYSFPATDGAKVTLSAKTKKGGLAVADLLRPDATPEPAFAAAVKAAKNGRSAAAKNFVLTGGSGEYVLRGSYQAGSKLKITAKVVHAEKASKLRLPGEPRFDRLYVPFPDRGIVGSVLTVTGDSFTYVPGDGGPDLFPRFFVGDFEAPRDTIERPSAGLFRFPVPPGPVARGVYDLTVLNADGQGAVFEDAFTVVPPPAPEKIYALHRNDDGTTTPVAGPGGGRRLRIRGADFRPNTVVLFGTRVAQPTVVLSNRIDVAASPNLAGTVEVFLRDDLGQTVAVPVTAVRQDLNTDPSKGPGDDPSKHEDLAPTQTTAPGRVVYADVEPLDLDWADPDETQATESVTAEVLGLGTGSAPPVTIPRVNFALDHTSIVPSSLVVKLNGVTATGWTADLGLGIVTFATPPAKDVGVTADYSYRVFQALGGEAATLHGSGFTADTVLTLDGVEIEPTSAAPTALRFVTPAVAQGTAVLEVSDRYEQSATVTIAFKGFADASATLVPAPVTTTNHADGWRGVRVLTGDVSGDGIADLVLLQSEQAFGGSAARSRVRVLKGTSSGGFTDVTGTAIPAVTTDEDWRALDGVLADLDGDDDLDLALVADVDPEDTEGTSSRLRLLRNGGTGTFSDKTADWAPATADYDEDDRNQGVAVVAADVDGKNGTDLVIAADRYFTKTTVTLIDEGDLTAIPPILPTYETTYEHHAGLRVLLNDGTGKLVRTLSAVPAVSDADVQQYQAEALAIGDVDGDDAPDLVLTRNEVVEGPSGTFHVTARLLRNSGGTFSDVSATDLPSATSPEYLQGRRVVLANADDDDDLDLFVLSAAPLADPATGTVASTPALRLFLNSGGSFTAAGASVFPAKDGADQLQASDVTVGDVDGDGAPDVVLVSSSAPNFGGRACRILRRTGSKWAQAAVATPDPVAGDDARGLSVVLTDLGGSDGTGDGDLDVVIVRNNTDETQRNTRVLVNPRR